MKKKKIMICVAACAAVLFAGWKILPRVFSEMVTKRLDLVEVVCASRDLGPRTVIEEADITFLQIPRAYLQDKAFVTKDDVIGKITTNQGFIPEGSLFYKSAVFEQSEIGDGVLFDLKENQVLFAMETDIVSLGANALIPGQVVDVYASVKNDDHESINGILIEKVRILGVKDHKGLDLNHPDSSKIPHVVQFALSKQAIPVIQKALSEGEISYYATADAYRINEECSVVWDGEIVQFLGIEKAIE